MNDEKSARAPVETRLTIHGMTCAMCVKHVTTALQNVPGVSAVQVTLNPGEARVRYDPAATALPAMFDAVRDAGYEAED